MNHTSIYGTDDYEEIQTMHEDWNYRGKAKFENEHIYSDMTTSDMCILKQILENNDAFYAKRTTAK